MDTKTVDLLAFAEFSNMMMKLKGMPLLTYNEVPRAKL
jgi:hypothetical protein